MEERLRAFWDRDAPTYDRAPSHAISDPREAAAWREVLARHLPPPPARVLDVGAGTGSISLLAAELGHEVTALDLSPAMLERARAKAEARGLAVAFAVGSSDRPPAGPFDAVVERHVLWTLPDPVRTLAAWRGVTRSGGRLLLLEGLWGEGPWGRARASAAAVVRRVLGVPPDHHAPYPPEVLASLPLAHLASPRPVVEAVAGAGWRGIRIERLRGVERARRRAERWPLGRLEEVVRYALTAEA